MTTLGPTFWNKLSQVSSSLSMDPKDLLAVMYFESGLNPARQNNGKATGLIQFMPSTLKGLGFEGDQHDFKQIDAINQLDFVEKYVRNQMRYNGGPFKSATQYYVANIWPVALKLPGVVSGDPNTPIIEANPKTQKYPGVTLNSEKQAYKENSILDTDKDGVISYGDLDKVMNGVKSSSGYRFALNQLESGKDYAIGTEPKGKDPSKEQTKPDDTYLAKVNDWLDSYFGAVAQSEQQEKITKKSEFKKYLDKTQLTITVKSSYLVDSIEFARILCLALDEEIQADTKVATDGSAVEIDCQVYGPGDLCAQAVAQLTESVSETFTLATSKIGGIKVRANVYPDTKTTLPSIDPNQAQIAYRRFHYKFI